MLAKNMKEAKANLKEALAEKNPKQIARATIEVMLNDKNKMTDLADMTRYAEPLLAMPLNKLKALRIAVDSAIKVKSNKLSNGEQDVKK